MNTQQSNGTSNQTALENEPASDEGQRPHQLACMEVWGGTRQVRLEVRLSGLAAWVYSMPIESSTGGGDVHYLSVCNAGLVSRIALADVSGHGPEVNTVAQLLLRLMHRYINDWDQMGIYLTPVTPIYWGLSFRPRRPEPWLCTDSVRPPPPAAAGGRTACRASGTCGD